MQLTDWEALKRRDSIQTTGHPFHVAITIVYLQWWRVFPDMFSTKPFLQLLPTHSIWDPQTRREFWIPQPQSRQTVNHKFRGQTKCPIRSHPLKRIEPLSPQMCRPRISQTPQMCRPRILQTPQMCRSLMPYKCRLYGVEYSEGPGLTSDNNPQFCYVYNPNICLTKANELLGSMTLQDCLYCTTRANCSIANWDTTWPSLRKNSSALANRKFQSRNFQTPWINWRRPKSKGH